MDTARIVVLKTAAPAELPAWLPATVRREALRIRGWLATAQADLACLPGAEPRHHRELRRIADELRRELLAPWGIED